MMSGTHPMATAIVLALFGFMLFFGGMWLPVHLAALAMVALMGLCAAAMRLTLPQKTWYVLMPALAALAFNVIQILPVTSPANPLVLGLHPMWQSAHNLGIPTHPALSIDPAAGMLPLLTALGTGILFILAAALGYGGHGKYLLRGLATAVTALSLYGIATYALGNNYVLTLPKSTYYNALSATFINRNTFATVAGIGAMLALAQLSFTLPNLPSARRATLRQRARLFFHISLAPSWPWLAMAAVNLLALSLTLSRGGIAAAAVALGLWWLVVLGKARGGRPFWLAFGALILLAGAVLLPTAGHNLVTRLDRTEAATEGRTNLNNISRAAIAANPWGYGQGTYNSVFRMYDTAGDPLRKTRMVHAHNSWLETLVENGIPATVLWWLSLGTLGALLARQMLGRRTGYPLPALGLGVGALAGFHAWVDFSPHNPAFTFLLATILGACWGGGARSPKTTPAEGGGRGAGRAVKILLVMTGAGLLAATAWLAPPWLKTARLDTALKNAATPAAMQQLLVPAHRLASSHPSAQTHQLAALANLLIAPAVPDLQKLVYQQALHHTNLALGYAPVNPYLWHQRAQLQNRLGQRQAASLSLTYSYLTGPSEGLLAFPRYALAMELWETILPDNLLLIKPHLRRLHEASPGNFRAEKPQPVGSSGPTP